MQRPPAPTPDLPTAVLVPASRPYLQVQHYPAWLVVVLLVLLAAAPASTKVAGAAWLVLVLLGVWAAWRVPVSGSSDLLLVRSSRMWLAGCAVAMLFQATATFYWSEPWGDRHVEWRLLLAAAATVALLRRLEMKSGQRVWLTHSLALSCCVALGVTYLYGRVTPSNPIPWAAGISFLVCVLLPRIWQPNTLWAHRCAWALAVCAGMVAVLLSQSRGSYGLVLWVGACAVMVTGQRLVRRRPPSAEEKPSLSGVQRWGAGAALVLLAVVAVNVPRIQQEPARRIQEALHDIDAIKAPAATPNAVLSASSVAALNTPVGSRIFMWHVAVDQIQKAPLLGHGSGARIAWIHQLGEATGSSTIRSLDHLHNDALTMVFDHGVLGLLAYASWAVALLWVVVKTRRCAGALSFSVAGILWMHLTAGLTNTNFGHNYYGVMLALSLSLAWILQRAPSGPDVSQRLNPVP